MLLKPLIWVQRSYSPPPFFAIQSRVVSDAKIGKLLALFGAERYERRMSQLDFSIDKLPDEPRLDKVIPFYVENISRSAARKLIENGSVYVNRKRCKMNAKVINVGDKLRVMVDALEKEQEDIKLTKEQILFEDKDIIVVNKPPLLPTHETRDQSRHHLVQALKEFIGERDKKSPKDVYLGIHHRLDRDTSGVIMFTKRTEANAKVAQAFQAQEVRKTYMAIVLGGLPKPIAIKSFLGPSPKNKRQQATVQRGGKFAETLVRAIATSNSRGKLLTMVEAAPKTGRTHQIRVHLSENNMPIIGDHTYGVQFPGAPRLMLHAWRLDILGKQFHAPLPQDFRDLDFEEPRA
jgi:23S rRNA pseudouridine1911/1915/1917 synthase